MIKKMSIYVTLICSMFLLTGCGPKVINVKIEDKMTINEEYKFEVSIDDEITSSDYKVTFDDQEAFTITNNTIVPNKVGSFTLTFYSTANEEIKKDVAIVVNYVLYNITYSLDGGINGANPTKITEFDNITLDNPSKEGYVFLGWYLTSNFAGEPINVINEGTTSDLKIYAKWELIPVSETEKIDYLNKQLRSLPEKLTLNDADFIGKLNGYYEDLSNSGKAEIYNYAKLVEANNTIKVLQEQVLAVNTAISNLSSDVSLENSRSVIDAWNLYSCLDQTSTNYVKDYNKLKDIMQKTEEIYMNTDLIDVYVKNLIETDFTLPVKVGNISLLWNSSNTELLNIVNGEANLIVTKQLHRFQTITITLTMERGNEVKTLTKDVQVAPIKLKELSSSPVATYVQSDAMSHYVGYSGRSSIYSDTTREVLDIAYYCFVTPTSEGALKYDSMFTRYLADTLKLREDGIRVLISLGPSCSAAFSDIAASRANSVRFAINLVNFMEEYGLDGVDIDWEFPGDNSPRSASVDRENMVTMCKIVREKLDEATDEGAPKYLLTSAIPSTSWGADRYNFKGLNESLDYVNMMSYDLIKDYQTTHLSALYTSSYDGGFGFSVAYGVRVFTQKGLDPNKIIIGCATYGKVYNVTGMVEQNAKYPGLGVAGELTQISNVVGSHRGGTLYYYGILQLLKQGYEKYIEYNTSGELVSSYLYHPAKKIFVSYESSEVFEAKYLYAKANGFGIMNWSYPNDATDCYIEAIAKHYSK